MKLYNYLVTSKQTDVDNSFIIRVKPVNPHTLFDFQPGQYCLLQNPLADNPQDLRPFSIASSPTEKTELEFCIKIYGEWTKSFSNIKLGDHIKLAGPFGTFVWDDKLLNVVFLVGGTGIAPILSMLRTIAAKKLHPKIKLLYGNRTPETILYKAELESLQKLLRNFEIIHIYSELDLASEEITGGKSYRGFITPEILKQEIDFSTKPTFFLIGPPIFIAKMQTALTDFSVREEQIIQESLARTAPSRSND